jgi:hypothetical protein
MNVKDEEDKAKAGIDVKVIRGTETMTAVTDANGVATVKLDHVKSDNIEIYVSPPNATPAWKTSITTYMRGAKPDTVIYPVNVVLKN